MPIGGIGAGIPPIPGGGGIATGIGGCIDGAAGGAGIAEGGGGVCAIGG